MSTNHFRYILAVHWMLSCWASLNYWFEVLIIHTRKVLRIRAHISLELELRMNFSIVQLFRYSCFIFPFKSSYIIFQCKLLLFPVCFSHLSSEFIILAWGTGQHLHRNWLAAMWKSYQPDKEKKRWWWMHRKCGVLQSGSYSEFQCIGIPRGTREVRQPAGISSCGKCWQCGSAGFVLQRGPAGRVDMAVDYFLINSS